MSDDARHGGGVFIEHRQVEVGQVDQLDLRALRGDLPSGLQSPVGHVLGAAVGAGGLDLILDGIDPKLGGAGTSSASVVVSQGSAVRSALGRPWPVWPLRDRTCSTSAVVKA